MILFTIKKYKLTAGTYIYAKLYFSDQKSSTHLVTFFNAYHLSHEFIIKPIARMQVYISIFVVFLLFICNYLFVTNLINPIWRNHWVFAVLTLWNF